MYLLQAIFYITGILFFLIVIIAAIIFIRQTNRTARQIKKILSSDEISNLIIQLREGVEPIMRMVGERTRTH